MDERDFPSSSDESDIDFVPKDEDHSDTASEVSEYETSEGEENVRRGRKRKKKNKKCVKKSKINKNEEGKEGNAKMEEKKGIDVDALWADFKKDVSSLKTKKTVENSNPGSTAECVNNKTSPNSEDITSTTMKQKGAFKFSTANKAGGLTKILNQIGKKDKMSTLQKSQLDWNNFKRNEGIEEEIKTYNRGKDGYLDKQDFLQRTDLRQFEIEKGLRCAKRKF